MLSSIIEGNLYIVITQNLETSEAVYTGRERLIRTRLIRSTT